jgi:tetratricopeptide (TPR) repeat protein
MSKGQSFFQVYSHLAFLLHGLGRPRKAANTAFYTVSIQILSIIVANKKKNTETETINSLFEKLRDAKSAEERDAIVRGDHASTKKLPAQSAPSAKESMEEQHNPALATSLCLTAVCCQSLGYYREAIQIFDKAMRADINHWCWFQREYALHQARYLDRDFSTFNMDVEFDPIYKEAWCKKVSMKTFLYFDVYASKRPPETSRILEKTKKAAVEYASVRKSYSAEMKELRALQNVVASSASTDPKVNDSPATAGTFMDACTALLTETAALQAWVHLDCVGFLPHCRMQSAFAIGAVQMAQQLRRHVRLVGMDADGPGLQVPNMSSSCPSTAPSQRPFYSEGDDGVLIGAMEAEGRERSKDVAACGGTGTATAATAPGRKNTKKKKKGQKSSSPTAEKSPSQEKGSSGVPESPSVASKETASSSSSSSSASARNGAHATGRRAAETNHTFCWRDFFDIGVRWRQAAEPNDPVWWIDGLPGNTFEEGFGLQTPIINGQLKTARYGRYFSKAFKLLKKHMKSHYILSTDERKKPSSEQVESLEAARSLAGLHAIVGENFYVIQPCYTATEQGTLSVLEGARITLVDHPPDGFDFSIRMPSTPKRWKQFESQICHIFQKVVHALNHLDDPQHNFLGSKSTAPTAPGGESESEDASPGAHGREQRVKALGLELFYYWCVFAPLTRGSALCGYMSLMAVALAAGCAYTGRLPNEKQLDWEAIFATNCDEFIETVSPWLHLQPLQQKGVAGSPSDVMQAIDVADTVRTLRHMNSLFNVAESLAESSADTCTNSSTSDLTG